MAASMEGVKRKPDDAVAVECHKVNRPAKA